MKIENFLDKITDIEIDCVGRAIKEICPMFKQQLNFMSHKRIFFIMKEIDIPEEKIIDILYLYNRYVKLFSFT